MTLKGWQKKKLRSLAHHLDPVVMVGKQGVTPSLIRKVDQSLESHELIKVRFVDFKEEKKELAGQIAAETKAEIAGIIGHVLILYKRHPEEEKRRIRL
jgi:RNA-binding protein